MRSSNACSDRCTTGSRCCELPRCRSRSGSTRACARSRRSGARSRTATPTSRRQAMVSENVVGAAGTLGTNRVAKAAPDGYTLLLMHVGQATAPALYAKLPFDPVGDFAPIGLVTDVPMILVARANFPAKDLKELVAYVRTQSDKVTYGNVGLGSASHLCGLMFMSAIEAKPTPIYYKGGGPALNDIIAGHIDVYCDPATGPTP